MAHYRMIPIAIQAWAALDLIEAAAKGLDSLPKIVADEAKAKHWIFSSMSINIPDEGGASLWVSYKDMVVRNADGFFYPHALRAFSKNYESV